MKILLLSNKAPYPPNDGSSIAIYNMARGLIEAGATVTLLTINTKKHFKPDEQISHEFKQGLSYHSVYQDTDVKPLEALSNLFFSKESYFVSRFYFDDFVKKLQELLRENQYDVIQLEGVFMGVYLPAIRELSNAIVSVRTHNVEYVIWQRIIINERNFLKKQYLQIQNRRLRRFEMDILPKVDAIVSITQHDADIFRQEGIKKPIIVSPAGVNLEEYEMAVDMPENKSVFHFGSMDWLPNEEGVLWFVKEVWPLVVEDVKEAKFYIAGRGIGEWLRKVESNSVSIIGEVAFAKEVYHAYNIMVVPLHAGSGMRIKLLEGMAFGKAIVSTQIGAEGIGVEHNKQCLLVNDAKGFAMAIIELLKSEEKCVALRQNARTFVRERFNNGALAKGVIDFYKELPKF